MESKQRLRREAFRWQARMVAELSKYGIRHFQHTDAAVIRFLTWKAWCTRYGVSLSWLVATILERGSYLRRGWCPKDTLGFNAAQATGPRMQLLIEQQLGKDFPESEHLAAQACELKIRMLATPRVITEQAEDETIARYVERYAAKAKILRRKILKKKTRFVRPFRGNPWR